MTRLAAVRSVSRDEEGRDLLQASWTVDERMNAAYTAFRSGRCDRARIGMQRAIQMDPNNRYIRAAFEEIERECSDPDSDRPMPRIRR